MSTVKLPATDVQQDLMGHQYKAININGMLATGPLDASGILVTQTSSGEDASFTVFGREMFISGGAIVKGNRLRVIDGGFLVNATSGSTSCGFAETSVSSGSQGRGFFNFAGQTYHVSSNGE